MDPSSPSEGSVEPKERRKIQFAVPPTEPTQLDPRQVEMRLLGGGNRKGLSGGRLQIRRRRPTPATLFKVADQTSPEDDISTHQWVVGENGVLKPKRINPNIYQPPSLKAVQQMAEAHMQKLGVYPHVEEEGEEPIQRGGEEISSSCTPDSQEQRGMAEHQLGMRKAGATAPTDEEEEEEEVEADNMADDECRNVD